MSFQLPVLQPLKTAVWAAESSDFIKLFSQRMLLYYLKPTVLTSE